MFFRLKFVVYPTFVLSFFLIFSSCTRSRRTQKEKDGNISSGGGSKSVAIRGKVKAERSFKEGEKGESDVRLVTGRIITGRIITGRIITARAPNSTTQEFIPVGGALVEVEELGISTRADSDGNFELRIPVESCPCKFTLSVGAVRKDGKSYRIRRKIEVLEKDVLEEVKEMGELVILATGGIAGKVKLEGAESNLGVYVYIPGTPMITITDEDGNFIMGDIPPGSYEVAFEKVGYETKTTKNVEVKAGELIFIGDFLLKEQKEKIDFLSGKILDAETSEPVAGAFIISDTGRSAVSDRYGKFRIYADATTLTVGKQGYELLKIQIHDEYRSPDKEMVINLSPKNLKKGAIKGKIFNWETTNPIPGVTVILLPFGNTAVTSNDGSFVIQDISPGSYTLMFIKSDYEIGVEPVSVENGVVIDLGVLGLIPECEISKFYADLDGDGFGNPHEFVHDCYPPFGYVGNSNDCDDSNTSIHPGAVEICNGLDDNCDGSIDEGVSITFYKDSDGDGYGNPDSATQACSQPSGYVKNNLDCDDFNAYVNPATYEVCDTVDNNCNGIINDGVLSAYYIDSDGDGYGHLSSLILACDDNGVLRDINGNAISGSWVSNFSDCDDTNPRIHPNAVEVCDTIDEDCDGTINNGIVDYYYRDSDGDGQGNASMSILACDDSGTLRDIYGNTITSGWYVANSLDCNDSNPDIRFGINETKCDGIDENCNGITDDGVLITFYEDKDRDGYGNPNSTTQACSYPVGYTSDNSDCDDTNPDFNPSMTEVVDGQDENCDGLVDNLSFKIETIDSLTPVKFIDLAIDNLRSIHVAFAYQAYGGADWFAYYKRENGIWWQKGTIYTESTVGSAYNVSIDVSPDGAASYMSYYSGDAGNCGLGICVNYYTGSWGAGYGKLVGSGTINDMKVDYKNSITHVVFVRSGKELIHIYATPSTPDFSASLSSIVYSVSDGICDVDMDISPDGVTVHIVFTKGDCSMSTPKYPYYTRNITPYNFNAWMPPASLTTYTYDVNSVGIAVSPDGVTHVCFTGRNTPYLYYMKAEKGGVFSTPQGIDGDGPMSSCSIALDKNGNPHIAYESQSFEQLKYATQFMSQWKVYSVTYVETTQNSDAVSIKVDDMKIPHVGFIGHNLPRYATAGK